MAEGDVDFKSSILLSLSFGWDVGGIGDAPSLVRVLHNVHLKEC
jgi:hypothetical protein